MKLARVRLDEVHELEPLVLATLSSLEDGLRPLSNQLSMGDAGHPDILAIDSDGVLVVIELKADTAGPSAVDQAIRYFEWAQANLALLSKPFPEIKHDRQPRVLLVAPEFEDDVLRLVRYLDLDFRLARVTCVRIEKGDTGVLLELVEQPRVESPPAFLALSDIVAYISDESVRKEFELVLDEMRRDGLSIQPWKGGKERWLGAIYGDTDVAYVQTCRSYFNNTLWEDDGKEIWPPQQLRSYAEWEEKAKPQYLKRPADSKA